MLKQLSQWIRQGSGPGFPVLSRWEACAKLGGPRAIPWLWGGWVGFRPSLTEDGREFLDGCQPIWGPISSYHGINARVGSMGRVHWSTGENSVSGSFFNNKQVLNSTSSKIELNYRKLILSMFSRQV